MARGAIAAYYDVPVTDIGEVVIDEIVAADVTAPAAARPASE